MHIKILLSLILASVWVELCSAQTAETYYLYDGLFFKGMPPGVCSLDISAFIIHKDVEGNEMFELKLQKGRKPAEGYRNYHTPVSEVPNGDSFLSSVKMDKGRRIALFVPNTLPKKSWIGESFPEFRVTDTTGKIWTLKDVIGKPMVLNFWYSGCGPCRKEMPELNRWMKLLPNVTYLATTFDEESKIKAIVENTPFLYTQIVDELFFFNLFKVKGMPVTILVDKKGIIRYIDEGSGAAKLRYLFDFLKMLVSE